MGMFIAINEDHLNMRVAAIWGAAIFAFLLTKPLDEAITPLILQLPAPIDSFIELWRVRMILYFVSAPFVLIYVAKYLPRLPFFKRDISYGVYLFAWPIQEAIVAQFIAHGRHASSIEVFAIAMPITLGVAIVSAIMVEEPALKLKNRRLFGWRTTRTDRANLR
ncbi:MAG: hypothetical protein PW999_00845 [Paraburkholderia tropica]|nr:hypothetical protein [Paraburkholderia tropica]